MPVKSKLNKFNIVLPVIIIVLLLDLFFLYYLKYHNQNLSLSEFRLYNIGNFLNMIFTIILIVGILIYSFQKKNKPGALLIISLTIIINVILILAVVSIEKTFYPDSFFLGHPLPKVITGFLFLSYAFIQFIFLSLIWLSIFGGRELLIIRAVVNSVIIVVILFLFAFLFLSSKNDTAKINPEEKEEGKIAVVLGAAVWSKNVPSPSLAARTSKAAELFRKGFVQHILLTGSNAPGELSEAEVAYNYIRSQNVDTTKVYLEKNTSSTSEQIEFIKNYMSRFEKNEKIVIVSDSYHLTRIKEICKFYNVKAEVVASDLVLGFNNKIYYKLRESVALIIFWFFAL